AERNKALGFWGAVGASGGTIGVLLGGILTDTIGWQWIFFINVPMALAVLVAAPLVLDESFARTHRKRFDVAGAATVTGGVALLVYALVEADGAGWGSTQTIGLLVAAGLLLVSFVAIERRSKAPLMPFSMFRIRTLTGANVAGLALGASVFGMIFIVTLYMQQVLGYTPIEAGLGWLAMSVAALAASMLGAQVVTRVGPRLPITVGLTLAALGLGLLSSISAGGSYATDLLVGLLVFGVGLGLAFVAVQIGALNDVADKDAGLASGLINTMQQVGGALGVAVLSTIAISQTGSLLGDGTPPPEALADGFSLALWAGAAFSLAGAAAASILLRGQRGTAAEAGEISGPPEAKAEATR
ncbi:MAG: MFS transporter, partial [Gaiellales bacterium]